MTAEIKTCPVTIPIINKKYEHHDEEYFDSISKRAPLKIKHNHAKLINLQRLKIKLRRHQSSNPEHTDK